EKEVNNLEEHGPKPNRVEVVNNDIWVTVESGSMPSTSMNLQDGVPSSCIRNKGEQLEESDDEIEELDDDTARYMSFTNRAGGGANDAGLLEDEDFDCYDGYEDQVYDLPEAQQAFCDQFDIRLRSRVRK
ncbi:hypothetical protein Tco_1396106, partial [Tanacetum coccineum]